MYNGSTILIDDENLTTGIEEKRDMINIPVKKFGAKRQNGALMKRITFFNSRLERDKVYSLLLVTSGDIRGE